MSNFLAILMCIAIAGACAYYAKRQGRNPYAWFLIGLIFGIFGLFMLFLIPLLKHFIQARLLKRRRQGMSSTSDTSTITVEATPVVELHTEPSYLEKLWYYLDHENKQLGPMSFHAFKQAWKEGKIASSTYVWNEELTSWKRFDEIFSFKQANT